MTDYGGLLAPPLGGPVQKLNRLGNRFYLDVTLPPMTYADGMAWIAALIRAQTAGAIFPWPQPGLVIGPPGTPLVNGGSQLGTSLVMDGYLASYSVLAGQFFNIIHSGRRYLHLFAAAGMASSGALTATIAPMLRVSPTDNDVIDISTPKIEGFLDGNERSWTISTARHVGLQFRITEAE